MAEMDFNAWNKTIIEEFRANGGKCGGMFEGASMLLLHTTGAKSGAKRINPLVYLPDGDRMIVFASKAGAPDNPDWYYNLVKNPGVGVEVGTDTIEATATVLEGAERDRLYAEQVTKFASFGEYEEKTKGIRTIPVIALTRTA